MGGKARSALPRPHPTEGVKAIAGGGVQRRPVALLEVGGRQDAGNRSRNCHPAKIFYKEKKGMMKTKQLAKESKMEKEPQKYIVRCNRAGVFFGEIKERNGEDVVMTNVRKVWYWDGACAVEELAVNGTSAPDNCKLTVQVDEMTLADPIQIIPCSEKAAKTLEGCHEWKRG